MEVWLPKFEAEIKAGYNAEGFCAEEDKEETAGAKDTNKKAPREERADSRGNQKPITDKEESTKDVGISFTPKLGFQVKFIALQGEGALRSIIPQFGKFEPDFLKHMWDIHTWCASTSVFDKLISHQMESPSKKGVQPKDGSNINMQDELYYSEYKGLSLGMDVPEVAFKWKEVEVVKNVTTEIIIKGKKELQTKQQKTKEKKQFWYLKSYKPEWEPTRPGRVTDVKEEPMDTFRGRLGGCKLTTFDEKKNEMVTFIGCMSTDPYIRSVTKCAMTEVDLGPEDPLVLAMIGCQDYKVYEKKDWIDFPKSKSDWSSLPAWEP
ncbi:hypothetical protein H072_245 [Dactylellina haptotyla CBS 200.50]|uniref:Uncharacterized protein n=1 Tax=Dactylellina haptotyla (strain CBS 200.50) TaxID=1284197 RepID=S8C221_DACHA|nr:hypothetical protein H072_245 [Dactylellina haptotyla CBS 200.50]